jgi:hypothetical protein
VVGYENIYKTLRCELGSKPKIVQLGIGVFILQLGQDSLYFSKEKNYMSLLEDCCKDWENYMVQ